jgi:hypothetical protein
MLLNQISDFGEQAVSSPVKLMQCKLHAWEQISAKY